MKELGNVSTASSLVGSPVRRYGMRSKSSDGIGRRQSAFRLFADQSAEDYAAGEEREFIQRLNGLSKALHDFAETHKGG